MIRSNVLPFVCVFACLLAATGAQAATQAQIDDARANGLAYLITSQRGDGSWSAAPGLEVQSTAQALEALAKAGMETSAAYSAAIAWLSHQSPASVDAQARQILALAKAGVIVNGLVSRLDGMRNPKYATWGAYAHYINTYPDTPLALEAVKRAGFNFDQWNVSMDAIVDNQNEDGGWPYTHGNAATPASQILATAHTLITLKLYEADRPALQSNISSGVAWLKAQQKPGGGFGEGSAGNMLDTVFAYQALVAVVGESDGAALSARDYLLGAGRQQADGSWGGNPFQTALALQTLPAATMPDTDGDGVPDVVEVALNNGRSTLVADGRTQLPGNGQGQVGVNAPMQLPNATQHLNYSHSLAQAGLTGFALISGSLPLGISIDGTGMLSGIPPVAGVYTFVYGASPSFSQLAELTVEGAERSDGDVPTLPEWGLMALGLGLLASMLRRGQGEHIQHA
jgi:hypothetical protein